jgi:hypothetical protein
MFYPLDSFDIFKTDSDGAVLWRGTAEDFIAAKKRIETLALSAPGEYMILNQRTGQRQRMRVLLPSKLAQADSPDGGPQCIEMGLTNLNSQLL